MKYERESDFKSNTYKQSSLQHMKVSHSLVVRTATLSLFFHFDLILQSVHSAVPVVEARHYRHGVEGQSQAQITDGEVDDEVLGGFQEVLFLVGDVQKCAVAKQWTHPCRDKQTPTLECVDCGS